MMKPGLAIGWTIWRRHRRGLSVVAVSVVLVVTISAVTRAVLPPGDALEAAGIAIGVIWPATLYLAAVFAYGFDAEMSTVGSGFPGRMFALPVRTRALAGWPIAYGAAAMTALWLAVGGLVVRPAGMDVPLLWPALLVAAQLSWMQALLWWPFGTPWSRPLLGMLLGHLPMTGSMLAMQLEVPEPALVAFLAAAVVVGVIAAYGGVARSRRGDVPESWLASRAAQARAPRRAFRSMGQALAWFEWRRTSLVLPLVVMVFTPLALLALFLDDTPGIVARTLGLTFIIPVFFAGMAGGMGGKNNPWAREACGVSSFAATRPVTTAAMVVAKLRSAVWTILVTWALVLTMTVVALFASGTYRTLGTMLDAWLAARPTAEVVAGIVLAIVLLALLSWKRLVEHLLVGLTGREWVIRGAALAGVLIAFNLAFLGMWLLIHPEYHGTVRDLAPWLMGVAVALKLVAAVFVIRELRRRRLLTDRTLTVLGA
ncbi:MAG TPA: hypothetical protein VKD90_14055, partial [Gemmataceae bacterium]|nr:hypothetical protein [Gemmataceae bacterium]